MGRALLAAEGEAATGNDVPFMEAKIVTARFHADHILSRTEGLRHSIVHGYDGVVQMDLEAY